MAIDFPNSPALNDYFESNGKAWTFNGTSWDIVQTPANLSIADASITGAKLASGAASVNLGEITLGTNTTGNYVSDVSASTGITVTHTPGEGSSPTIAIGQDVGTSASVTFTHVTADLIGNVTGNASTVTNGLYTSSSINELIDVDTVSASPTSGQFLKWNGTNWVPDSVPTINALDDIGNVSASAPTSGDFLKWDGSAWVNDAVDLGTDTTGNYMSDLTQGTGVTITHTPGEGSNATVAIGQSVATSASVTFAQVDTTGDLTVGGNLTVNGTTTTLNTETLSIEDNIIVLNSNVSASPSVDAGIEIERGTSSNVQIRWNETTDKWQFTNDGTNYTDFGAGGALISKLPNYRTTTTRTNLVPNPNFEVNTTGWTGIGGSTLSQSSTSAFVGTSSMLVTDTDTGLAGAQTSFTPSSGTTYSFSCYVKNTSGLTRLMYVQIGWSGGTFSTGTFVSVLAGGDWTRISVTGTAPNSSSAALYIVTSPSGSTETAELALIDAVLLEVASSALPYFDGTYADAYTGYTLTEQAWNGTADASTSTATWGQDSSYVAPIEGALWFDSDTAQTFVYYDSQWIEIGASAMGATVSTTAPNSPIGGQIWFNSDTGGTYVYYGSAWVEVGAAPVNLLLQAIDAKGDLLVGTADNTVDNLAVGANGSVLMADSSTATGLSWSTQPLSNRNVIINGAMQVAQRGTSVASITTGNYHTIDRYRTNISGAAGTWTQSQTADAPTGSGFRNCLKVLCTTAKTPLDAGSELAIIQRFEGQNLQSMRKGTASAQSVTASFWVKANKTGTYICELYDYNNNRHVNNSYTITTADVWQYVTIVFPPDTTGAFTNDANLSLHLCWFLAAGSNFTSGTLQTAWGTAVTANRAVGQVNLADATSNYWQVTGVQLEVGAVATPFEFEDFGTTLAKCLRYYILLASGNSKEVSICTYYTTTTLSGVINLPAVMRTTPTFLNVTGTNYFIAYTNGGSDTINTITIQVSSPSIVAWYNSSEALGTAGMAGTLRTNNASAVVAVTAEL